MVDHRETSPRLVAPIWPSILIALIGATIGIVSIINGVDYFSTNDSLYLATGAANLILGIAMIAFALLGIVFAFMKKTNAMIAASLSQLAIYALIFAIINFMVISIYQHIELPQAEMVVLIIFLTVFSVIIGIVGILVSILELVAVIKSAKGKTAKGFSIAAGIIFLLPLFLSVYGLISQVDNNGVNPSWSWIIAFLSFLLTIFTIVTSCTAKAPLEQHGKISHKD